MAKVVIEFDTDNDAFDKGNNAEVVRVMRDAARKIEHGIIPATLFDLNGNNIGSLTIDDERGQQ